ncbi:ESCRT-0 subunit protein hse1, partial [Spiromyces aspiralis]
KATDEKLTTENWELNLNICDHVTSPEDAHEYFKAINKRMLHRNANVLLYTLSVSALIPKYKPKECRNALVDALVKNCSEYAKPEVASRAFTTTLVRVLNDKGIHEEVKTRILGYIQQWAFEFRQESNLSLMEETYRKLRSEGMRFPQPQKPEKIPKASEQDLKKEEDDLQLALALSLSDYQLKADKTTSHIREEIKRQAHISGSQRPGEAAKTSSPPKPLKVRALYDFKATEAGELGFYKGDVIEVLDQKFRDWWKGRLHGQTGIFPANFV